MLSFIPNVNMSKLEVAGSFAAGFTAGFAMGGPVQALIVGTAGVGTAVVAKTLVKLGQKLTGYAVETPARPGDISALTVATTVAGGAAIANRWETAPAETMYLAFGATGSYVLGKTVAAAAAQLTTPSTTTSVDSGTYKPTTKFK